MAEPHVISALVSKRAEMAGLLEHHKKQIARIADEIKTLDSTIKLFDPEYKIQGIKTKRHIQKNTFFKRGETHRPILDVMREAGEPIDTISISEAIMKRKEMEVSDEQMPAFKTAVMAALKHQKKSGNIMMTGKHEHKLLSHNPLYL